MSTTPVTFMSGILSKLQTTKQIDLLHISIINLLDMMKEGEIDLVLEQPKKTDKQKLLFLQKVVDNIEAPELKHPLIEEVKAGNIDFFLEKHLKDLLLSLQREAEKVVAVKLTVAIDFEKQDLREMVDMLSHSLNRQAVLDLRVEHSLVAGAIVQYGNYISDYSLRTRLQQFREQWKEAAVEKA